MLQPLSKHLNGLLYLQVEDRNQTKIEEQEKENITH